MTLELVGEIVICLAGIVVVSMSSVVIDQMVIDQLGGVESKDSISARVGRSFLDTLKCVFLIWLMNTTVFGD